MQTFKPPHSEETKALLLMLRAMGWRLEYRALHGPWMSKTNPEMINDFGNHCDYRAIPPDANL